MNASFGMSFPKLPTEMNITFSEFIYFPTYFGLVIVKTGVLGVRKKSLSSFIATIRFMFHSTGPTFINPKLTFITSCLIGFSYFRSPIWFKFWIKILSRYSFIASNLLLPYSIFLCPTLNQCSWTARTMI